MREESRGAHTRVDYPGRERRVGQVQRRSSRGAPTVRWRSRSGQRPRAAERWSRSRTRRSRISSPARSEDRRVTMAKRTFKVWRGDKDGGDFKTFEIEVGTGMVVLDVLHQIQADQANDLALRWNCKAGKCGSLLDGDQRQAEAVVHDAHEQLRADETITVAAAQDVPGDQGPRHRRVVELQAEQADPDVQAAAARTPTARIGCIKKTSIACRSSASASSATCARTSATCCVIATAQTTTSSSARAS